MEKRHRSSTRSDDYTFELVSIALAILLLWVTASV